MFLRIAFMRHVAPVSLLVFCLSVLACRDAERPAAELRILRSRELRQLPSASGITRYDERFFINSDNAPYLYVLSADGLLEDSIGLLNEDPWAHEIPKPRKPDYEAAALIDWNNGRWLILFGSGSMSPHRDSALIARPGEPFQTRKASLRPFYNAMVRAGIPAKSINIEAAANSRRTVLLFNRGTNSMITTGVGSFAGWLIQGQRLPSFTIHPVALPAVKGFNPGISGATMLNDSIVLFCGSVEATTDWAKDGEILGSGIGILRILKDGRPELLRWTMLKSPEGQLMRKKLEGIEVLRGDPGVVTLRCVTDNDNGGSELMDIELPLPPDAMPE
jgi:hypothetical protein